MTTTKDENIELPAKPPSWTEKIPRQRLIPKDQRPVISEIALENYRRGMYDPKNLPFKQK